MPVTVTGSEEVLCLTPASGNSKLLIPPYDCLTERFYSMWESDSRRKKILMKISNEIASGSLTSENWQRSSWL